MNSTDTYNDIKEVNLSYLMLAQNMVRSDREGAIFRLGISEEIADVLARLTPGQVLKMASSDMLLCNFRFEDTLLLDLLANHERDRGVGHLHAAILAAGRPVCDHGLRRLSFNPASRRGGSPCATNPSS
ncbi:MAG: flagellar transcriptional regulator FlhD [Sulfuritalea sp.]|nr:flagellar transcriptional regulator FlhD [Sulfuritalea sp.]